MQSDTVGGQVYLSLMMPDKGRERFYLEMLRRTVHDVPASDPTEPEPPDFLFSTSDGSLGIDFTLFHLPPPSGKRPHQERQSLKDRIVDIAERLHQKAGGPALYVGVYFNANYVLDKKDTSRLSREIAESVLHAPTPLSIQEPVVIPWGHRPEETYGIHIMKSVDGQDKLWHADAGGWVATITADQVRDVLRTKGRMVTRARSRCEKLWLVIVNDAFSRGAPAEISDETLEQVFEAAFGRVLWFLPHASKAHALKLRAPAAQGADF